MVRGDEKIKGNDEGMFAATQEMGCLAGQRDGCRQEGERVVEGCKRRNEDIFGDARERDERVKRVSREKRDDSVEDAPEWEERRKWGSR